MSKKNLKVAWICHFSNIDVRSRLPLSGFLIINWIKKLLGKKNYSQQRDFAPWINNLIREFERFNDVELHVIAPHKGLKTLWYEFEVNGVFYHFFKPELTPISGKVLNKLFRHNSRKFRLSRFLVKRFIKQINPDIVNLIGTENPYYSITTLDIITIPVLVLAQTVYTNPNREILNGSCDPFTWETELKIHRKEKYFGCGGRMHRDLILKNNPDAIIFKNLFPISKPVELDELPQVFDFVFFAAGITPKKGIEDALDALAIVKKSNTNATLSVVGMCNPVYKRLLNKKILELDLVENVSFNDYFPAHSDMYQHIKKSKFAILPIKLDVIPGTVLEAMLLEIPVVTYKTTGTPYLNKNGETVLLADIGDTEALAKNMLQLLQSSDLAEKLKKAAKSFVEREFDNTKSAKRLVNIYRAVIDHYQHNTQIPEDLLFDLEEFPIY